MKRTFAAILALCIALPTCLLPFFNPVDGSTIARSVAPSAFATLGSPPNGALRYCSNCSATSPCTGSGSGALARREAGAWNCSGGGMANPMTTAGDIIVGGASGTPARLAAGTNGHVLTLSSGSPVWAAAAAGITASSTDTLTNKTLTSSTNVLGGVTMTLGSDATGDIYYRNSGGVLTRLAAGTNGHVLTLASGLPSWAAAGGGGGATINATDGRLPYRSNSTTFADSPFIRHSQYHTAWQDSTFTGANVRTFDWYFTSDTDGASPTNYKRLRWHSGAGDFNFAMQSGGTGGTGRFNIRNDTADGIYFYTDSTERMFINTSGRLLCSTDGGCSFGNTNSTNRPQHIHLKQELAVGQVYFDNPSDGFTLNLESFGGNITTVNFQNLSADQLKIDDGGTKPTCNSTNRGIIWHDYGGAGVKDTVEVCAKDAADAYAYRTIY